MKLKKMLAGQLLVLALAFPHMVWAEDFTISVPVKFSNIHEDVDKIKVLCVAKSILENGFPTILGNGSVEEDVPENGNLKQTITVKFNASTGKNPADAKSYECSLFVVKATSESNFRPSNYGNCTNPKADWFCAKAGTTLKVNSSGPIP